MEEVIYKLETISKIKHAVSGTYNSVSETDIYHECMEYINDIENDVIKELRKYDEDTK